MEMVRRQLWPLKPKNSSDFKKIYLTSSDMEENVKEDDSGIGSDLIFTTSGPNYLTLKICFLSYVSWKVLKL